MQAEFDNFKIYSNENVINTLTSMISSERLSHAFLIYGEKGLGKKTLAKYVSAQILCKIGVGQPCGKCKECKMIGHSAHPDVIFLSQTSDSKAFSVKSLREICLDAYITPNQSEHKIYVFADSDMMSVMAQNTLLKLIEEPPVHAIFIFTATSKSVFLPTILSRVISLGVSEVGIDDCKTALSARGIFDEGKINSAISAFGGNIGMCLAFLTDESLPQAVEIAKNIADKLASTSEYALLSAVSKLEGNKAITKTVILLLCGIIRDCATIRLGNDCLISCYKDGARSLARTISLKQADEIFKILTTASHRIDGNANLPITLSSICANIKSIT